MIKQTDIFKWERIVENKYINWVNVKVENLIKEFWGYSFNNWLFRIHTFESYIKWINIIEEYFIDYKWKFSLFWFDWVWRQFALNLENENEIYIFDICELEVYISDYTLIDFLSIISLKPIDYFDQNRFYSHDVKLKFNECISHKIPLMLWWEDVNSNMEVTNMEVDCWIVWQLHQKI